MTCGLPVGEWQLGRAETMVGGDCNVSLASYLLWEAVSEAEKVLVHTSYAVCNQTPVCLCVCLSSQAVIQHDSCVKVVMVTELQLMWVVGWGRGGGRGWGGEEGVYTHCFSFLAVMLLQSCWTQNGVTLTN